MKKLDKPTFVVEIHEIINGRGTVKYISEDAVAFPIYTNNPEYFLFC